MLERVSALAGVASFVGEDVTLAESSDFAIREVWFGDGAEDVEKSFLAASKIIMAKQGVETLKVASNKYWCISSHDKIGGRIINGLTGELPAAETVLISGRTRIAISGPRSRNVLAKCAAVDFHPHVFKLEHFVMTGIHHIPVLIHCTGAEQFHIYVMRTFALSLWEILVDATGGSATRSSG
jgi:heterotetrameric sarcosine oxidase gamma subunit